jgi:phage terminase Nu1 subunit (DNA packaging protein)
MVKLPTMLQQTKLPKTVSGPQLASLFGVSLKTVSLWQKAGTVVRVKYGRYDLARSVQGYARHHREAAKRTTAPGLETGAEARARLARLKADIAEKEYRRSTGETVDAGEIFAQLDKRMTVYWREVRQIPWVLAGTLSFVDREMAMLLGRELHRCLSNIGHGRRRTRTGRTLTLTRLRSVRCWSARARACYRRTGRGSRRRPGRGGRGKRWLSNEAGT